MKRILLLSAAAFGVMVMSAEERDITPKNYVFCETTASTVDQLGITDDEPCGPWNLPAYYWESHVKSVYNGGYLTWGGGNGTSSAPCKAMMDIVDFGGEVGKVLAISTPGSGINNVLKEKFGDKAPQINLPTTNAGAHEWFWYLDGVDYPVKSSGKYGRIRIEFSVYANTMKSGLDIGGNLYINDNANNVRPADDNGTSNNPISTIESAIVVEGEDENGDPVDTFVWSPDNWCVMEWYFDCAAADEHSYGPKVKMNLGDEGSYAPYTLFIRRFEITEVDGECPARAPHQRTTKTLVANPGTSGIDAIENNENAPAEYFNLQGIRVDNPQNGIFIKKQGKKVEKVLVK